MQALKESDRHNPNQGEENAKHIQDGIDKQKEGKGHWKPELASDSEEAVSFLFSSWFVVWERREGRFEGRGACRATKMATWGSVVGGEDVGRKGKWRGFGMDY